MPPRRSRKRKASERRVPEARGSFFSINSLIDRRATSLGVEYLVHWEGYTVEEATWEPIENLPQGLVDD